MVKIDKASKGIKCQKHMMAAADYISRHGMIDLEDENGEFLTHDELESRIEDWCKSQNTPYEEDGKKRAADARRLVISCPKGTDPEAVKKAVRELAKECFANDDYRYLFAIHNRSKEMPNEPDHPHVHLLIKTGVMGDLLSNFVIFGVAIELSLCFDVKMFYILLITEAKERSL